METTKTINRLKFDTFRKKRNKTYEPLPKWFNERIFLETLRLLNTTNKLEAVKYLFNLAKEKNTSLGLKWAKVEIVDEISHIGGGNASFEVTPQPHPDSMKTIGSFDLNPSINSISKQEVLRVLEPFARMANQCLHNSNLHRDQVVYAYNNAQITMQDLRNVEALLNRLTR